MCVCVCGCGCVCGCRCGCGCGCICTIYLITMAADTVMFNFSNLHSDHNSGNCNSDIVSHMFQIPLSSPGTNEGSMTIRTGCYAFDLL